MNVLSVNIRGLGSRGKPGWINRLKNESGVSFIGLQETMSNNVKSAMVSSFWGGLGHDFESVEAEGNSGGILSIWDPNFFYKDSVVKDPNFLLVSGSLSDGKTRINFLNVYAPQDNTSKRSLWDRVLRIIQSGSGWWVIFGDFNAVRNQEERKNSVFDPVCSRDFNAFVDEAGLREYDLIGKKFTYMVNHRGVCKLSRIDRVFVCENVFNKWSNGYVRALNREKSDHAPLLLSLIDTNFGPKPFRWFDSWIDRQGCLDVINSVMEDWVNAGPADLNLSKKLKVLRDKLKVWIADSRIKEKQDESRLKQEKENLDILMEHQDLEEEDVWVWSECVKCLDEIELLNTQDIRQKSRSQWASLGDENSSYFHNIVKGRHARNAIPGLLIETGSAHIHFLAFLSFNNLGSRGTKMIFFIWNSKIKVNARYKTVIRDFLWYINFLKRT
jgi:exonuclease III